MAHAEETEKHNNAITVNRMMQKGTGMWASPKGRMPKGSSIWTPISSTPNSRKAMVTAAGTMTQWQARHRVKGRKHSQMTRKLCRFCLYNTKDEMRARRAR